jgi:hypothetical protein
VQRLVAGFVVIGHAIEKVSSGNFVAACDVEAAAEPDCGTLGRGHDGRLHERQLQIAAPVERELNDLVVHDIAEGCVLGRNQRRSCADLHLLSESSYLEGDFDASFLQGTSPGFIVKIDQAASQVVAATYIQGTNSFGPSALATDGSGNLLVMGGADTTNPPVAPGSIAHSTVVVPVTGVYLTWTRGSLTLIPSPPEAVSSVPGFVSALFQIRAKLPDSVSNLGFPVGDGVRRVPEGVQFQPPVYIYPAVSNLVGVYVK